MTRGALSENKLGSKKVTKLEHLKSYSEILKVWIGFHLRSVRGCSIYALCEMILDKGVNTVIFIEIRKNIFYDLQISSQSFRSTSTIFSFKSSVSQSNDDIWNDVCIKNIWGFYLMNPQCFSLIKMKYPHFRWTKENWHRNWRNCLCLPWLSYCQIKYDNHNRLTKHLLKPFGSDM